MPLHVHEFGPANGYPILALHGVGGHGGRWRALAGEQLPGFRVLAPDLRGHGRSTAHPPWTLEQHAADLLAVLDDYALPALTVVGHSFGGAIALHLARLAPQRVGKLVLLDPAVGLDPAQALQRAEAPHRVFANPEQAMSAQRSDWPGISEAAIAAEINEHLLQSHGGWHFRYRPVAVAAAWSEMARAAVLPNAGTPTLLVPALRAHYVRDEFVRACQVVLGDDFQVFGLNAGHMVYLERPSETGQLIAEFIRHH